MDERPIRVLLVEDNPGDIRLIREMMADAGEDSFNLHTATMLSTGLKHIAKDGVDIVLLDLGLPDSHGLDALSRLQAEAPELPVVVLTGLDDEALGTQAVQQGAQDYLVKGQVDGNLLARAIHYAIERKRIDIELRRHHDQLEELVAERTGELQQEIAERMRVEEALRQERDLLDRIVTTSPAGITVVNREGQITYANAGAERVLGLTKDEITQRTYDAPSWRITDYDGNPFPDEELPFQRVMASRQPVYGVRHAIEWPDGRRLMLSVNGAPLFDETGEVDGMVAAIEDVTRQVQAQRELQESQRLLSKTFASLRDAIFIIDADTVEIMDCNPAASEIFGYSRQEMLGRTTAFLHVDEAALEEFRKHLYPAVEEKGFLYVPEFKMKRKSGEVFSSEHTVSSLEDEHGKRTGWVSVVRDITRRVRAEGALRESEERYRSLFETMGQAIVISGPDGRVISANPAAARMFGRQGPEVMIGSPSLVAYANPADREAILAELMEKGHVERFETILVKQDGSGEHIHVTGSATLRRDEQGQILRTEAIFSDITERVRAEEALQQRTAQLEALRQATLNITAELELDALLKALTESALELLGADMGGIYLYRPERDVLEWSVCAGSGVPPVGLELKRGEGLSGRVWESGKPLLVDNYSTWEGRAAVFEGYNIGAAIAVPIHWGDEFLGVAKAKMTGGSPRAFSEDDARLLSLLADQAAVAIHNARLYEEVSAGHEHLRDLTQQLVATEEAERQRIARELHDQVGQNLTALGLNLNILKSRLPDTAAAERLRLEDSLALVGETTQRIRGVMADLRPPTLDDYGLVAALSWYGQQFAARSDVPVTVQAEPLDPRLPVHVESALFRIAQEALTNVAKYAQATQVVVTVEADDQSVRMVVADDGVGFNPDQHAQPDRRRGWGLLTMRERAEGLGGTCRIESRPGQGTRIVVEVAR